MTSITAIAKPAFRAPAGKAGILRQNTQADLGTQYLGHDIQPLTWHPRNNH